MIEPKCFFLSNGVYFTASIQWKLQLCVCHYVTNHELSKQNFNSTLVSKSNRNQKLPLFIAGKRYMLKNFAIK